MNEDLTFKEGEFGFVKYKSKNPFEFFHIIHWSALAANTG